MRLYALAFLAPAVCFFALFAFGNAAAPWIIGLYVIGLLFLARLKFQEVWNSIRIWLGGLTHQSIQGPGFSTLELAVLQGLHRQASVHGAELLQRIGGGEVISRYNSGSGSTTRFRLEQAIDSHEALRGQTAWFCVDGVASVVGAQLWLEQDSEHGLLEFFCGGEDTHEIDWTRMDFSVAPPDAPRPPVPTMAPVVAQPRSRTYRFEA